MSIDNDKNNETKNIIKLKQSETLKHNGLVIDSVYYIDTNDIRISLNHAVNADIIFTVDRKKWQNNFNTIVEQAEDNGIFDKELKQLLIRHLNDNHDEILKACPNATNDKGFEEGDEEERISLPQKLVELALNNCMLFKDEFGIPHTLVKIDDYYDVLPVETTKFKRYISKLYYDANEGKIAYPEAVKTAVAQLEAKAEFEGKIIPLHLRVAWSNPNTKDVIYYDLSDPKRRCVKITDNNWNIVDNQIEVLFRRYRHLSPQIEPIKVLSNIDDIDNTDNNSKTLDKFIDLLNIKDDDNKLLLKCYIISLFIPDVPKPILMLHGEQGSAKSTLQELIKMVVDPNSIKTLTFPRDSNDFIQQLSHNYVAVYDNISDIKEWISDLLCRAVTGSSFSKRALWTNDDDFYYNFKRVVGLNGINLGATKADLLDRGLIIQLERIPKTNRKKVEEIWKEFEELKPKLLGYIFDVLVKVLQFKNNNPAFSLQGSLNRMADWEEYGEIISRCIGNTEGEFQQVYQENIGIQIDEAIAASPLSLAVVELMKAFMKDKIDEETGELTDLNTKLEWKGTPTKLSEELNNIAIGILNININKIKSWPKSPNYLSRRLNEVKTNLREKGIEIETGSKDEKDNRQIIIRKVLSILSNRRNSENQAQNDSKNVDNNFDNTTEKLQPTVDTVEKQDQNQAQKQENRQHDSIDDTIHTKKIEESKEEKYRQEQEEMKNWNTGLD
jgi:hypothetical protein